MRKEQTLNYAMISLCQFIFSILVLLLHAQRIFPQDEFHFLQKSMLSRMAVPFFLICSSFFLQKHQSERGEHAWFVYLKRLGRSYLFWSSLYLPYAIAYFFSLKTQPIYLPLALLVAFLYTGTCYHLWYIPAFIFAQYLLRFLQKYLKFQYVFAIVFLLYLFGMAETYSAYFEKSLWITLYNNYRAIFFTSRNGLFFVPIFICLGKSLYDYRFSPVLTRHPFKKFLLSLLFWSFEACIVFQHQGLDKNFFLGLLPTSFFFFNWISRIEWSNKKKWTKLKTLSIYYFFIHPIFIEIGFIVVASWKNPLWQKGIIVAIGTLLGTHVVSYFIIYYQEKLKSKWKGDLC